MLGKVAALFRAEYLAGELFYQAQRLPPLVSHQTDRRFLHHRVQHRQIPVLEALLFRPDKVVPKVVFQLGPLLPIIREIYEEPRAHVPLEVLDALSVGRLVGTDEEVAVLQQSAAADLLGVSRRYQLLVQVVQRLLEVPVNGLADHRRVEVLSDGELAAVVEKEEGVEHDLEGVHGELKRSFHGVDEFELYIPVTPGVSEGDERPPVSVVIHLNHLAHVGLLHAAGGDALLADALREEVEEGAEHRRLDSVEVPPGRQFHPEDEVEVVVVGGLRGQHVCRRPAVESNVPDFETRAAGPRVRLQLGPDGVDEVPQPDLQCREVASPVDGDHLVHQVIESADLLVAQHCEPLLPAQALHVTGDSPLAAHFQ